MDGWLESAKRRLVCFLLASLFAEAVGHVSPCEAQDDAPAILPQPRALSRKQTHPPDPHYVATPPDMSEVASAQLVRVVSASATVNWESLATVSASASPITDVSSAAVRDQH